MARQRNLNLTERSPLLHIEAPGCIINIHCGLRDMDGRKVVNISVEADGDRYSGDPEWWVDGELGNKGRAVRVVCTGRREP